MKLHQYGNTSWVYFYKNDKRTRRFYRGHINPEDVNLPYPLQGIVWEKHGYQIQINQYEPTTNTWHILPGGGLHVRRTK